MGPFTVGQIPGTPQVFVFYKDDGTQKDLTSYTGISANLINSAGTLTHPGVCTIPDTVNNKGTVSLAWSASASPFPVAGQYRIQIEFTGPGAIDDPGTWSEFTVVPVAGTSIPCWATITDVSNTTGALVNDEQLVTAELIIESVSNRTPGASAWIKRRDILWLNRAVCYQAAWQLGQPDLFTRSAVAGISQDGVAAVFTSKAAIYLAPLAIRSLKNVSWLKSKSLRMQTPFIDGGIITPAAIADDTLLEWEAMQ